ncbi:hypothetical protein GYMLUDRAFT_681237 [Collybiopsis luxurians FD-317 M1]|uniref:DUF6533 domain-containing protein n=1 Tax=Collybiopsis luxurians FD-317 M1 TaxID=944289 RepID=A0A0D0C9C7_9AGAR|nr:hypothetical protein GYMLUDRAFT_681237 [Collybiopsis luxurians FD-317 M1]
MSNRSLEDLQVQVNWGHYIQLMELVILLYDWFLTMEQEVEYFWRQDCKKLPAIFFFINRYVSILGFVAAQVLFFRPDLIIHHEQQLASRDMDLFIQVLMFIIQINVIALFILRVVALYGGSRRMKVFLSIATLCVFINSVVQLYLADWRTIPETESLSVVELIGVESAFSKSQGLYLTYLWIGLSAFDLCVFSLTLRKTLGLVGTPGGIMTVIMRDGLMYFGIITLMNLGNILIFVFAADLLKGLFTTFSVVLSGVLMSRMMINLREDRDQPMPSQLSGLAFAQSDHENSTLVR